MSLSTGQNQMSLSTGQNQMSSSTGQNQMYSSTRQNQMSSPTEQNQISMVANDPITKALFKVSCNRDMTLIQVASVLEGNNRQHEGSSIIRRISFEKLCHLLRMDFKINSTFDIFQVSDDGRMAVREDRHLQSLVVDLSNSGGKKINLIVELPDAQNGENVIRVLVIGKDLRDKQISSRT